MIVGTGVDMIEIARIARAIDKWGDHFLSHVFCDEEIQYALNSNFPAQHFAARFAAKEAVYKALGENSYPVGWKDIRILNRPGGKPYCFLNKKDFTQKVFISLSHTEGYAIANAIITE